MVKKIICVLTLSLALIAAYTPVSAFAADAAPAEGEVITMSLPAPEETISGKDIKLQKSDVLLENYMAKEATREAKGYSAIADTGKSRGSKLTGTNAEIYRILKKEIETIADGKQSSALITIPFSELGDADKSYTAEELGVNSVYKDNDITDESMNALVGLFSFDLDPILNALLADLPYDLYWFDKKAGIGYAGDNFSFGAEYVNGEWKLYFDPESPSPVWQISLTVSKEYSATGASNTTDVDTAKTSTAKSAAEAAGTIVATYKDSSDLEKLKAYKDTICNLVSYDFEGYKSATPDENIWQMIYVFDGDTSTNVVCEGYSKAFQFLCDLTEFKSSRIHSYLVGGDMDGGTGAGPHMWNILHMNDNKNYMVDVTNCDEGTIGFPDYLFLKGYASGNVQNGYVFNCDGDELSYVYDADTFNTYSESELKLSSTEYKETEDIPCGHEWGKGTVTKEPDCQNTGIMTYTCELCGETTTEEIEKTDHQWVKVGVTKKATYTETGVMSYYCKVCGIDGYTDIPKLTPKKQNVTVTKKTKTVKYKKLKQNAITVAPITVKGNKGTLSYSIVSGNAKSQKALKLNKKTGKIKVKKKTKKGTYSLKIKVRAAATANKEYKVFTKNVTIKVVVK